MTQHSSRLRPVARDADNEWRALPLLREVWHQWRGLSPETWMLWCETCQDVILGTAMAHTADCDFDDLMPRMGEFRSWQDLCQRAHQEHPAPRVFWVVEAEEPHARTGDTLVQHRG